MELAWVRQIAIAVFATSSALAAASWAVRTRKVPPFSSAARLLQSVSDPLINPIQRRLHRAGGNPVNAPWWLFGGGLVAALLLVWTADFLVAIYARGAFALNHGAGGLFWFGVQLAGQGILLALWIRVIGTWVGVHRYTTWMRPCYVLTDWIVEPVRRYVPNVGAFDISPLIVWFILTLVLRALPG